MIRKNWLRALIVVSMVALPLLSGCADPPPTNGIGGGPSSGTTGSTNEPGAGPAGTTNTGGGSSQSY